jgi:pimeloyl-ACP methyl ester carboxylesterase
MKWALLSLALLLAAGCGDDNGQGPVDTGSPPAAGCTQGTLESGALSLICFPDDWNGTLVVYAHGYVEAGQPVSLPDDEISGVHVAEAVTGLGYAYATTSYRANGLVVIPAVEDIAELIEAVRARVRPDPDRTLLVGFSEGGLVTALAIERHPDLIDGALAACGPIGDFTRQIDYFEDARVLFDYYFPGVLPGTAVEIPAQLRSGWADTYEPAVLAALTGDPATAAELAAVAGIPVPDDAAGAAAAIDGVLWYNVFGTGDAQARLGGQPYSNIGRQYTGSSDDAALNAGVVRYEADASARAALSDYDASGDLPGPVVTLHTTGDPVVPFFHEALYHDKVEAAGRSDQLQQRSVERDGHCAFTLPEVIGAFNALAGPSPSAARAALARHR